MREALTPAGGQLPVLALDVVDDRRARPAEQCRHDQTDALAAPGRSERHDVLGTVVTKIALAGAPEENARFGEKPGRANGFGSRPSSRPLGGDVLALAGPPYRSQRQKPEK